VPSADEDGPAAPDGEPTAQQPAADTPDEEPTAQQPAAAPPDEEPTAQQPVAPAHAARRRRGWVAAVMALATLFGVLAVLSVWLNRQIFNTENWTNTSTELLAAPRVQVLLGDVLTNEAFDAVDVEKELEKALPEKIRGLAGPASAGLRQLATQLLPQFLASAPVQEAWREANEVAQKELLKLLEGGGKALSSTHGEVVLHLKPLVDELAAQLGLTSQLRQLEQKLHSTAGEVALGKAHEKIGEAGVHVPANGEIVLLRSDQLAAAQDFAKAIKGFSVVLPLLAILLFAAAVALAAGWRRIALRTAGWCIAATGLIAVLTRNVAGEQLVNAVVREPNRPAILEAWKISTTQLYDIAIALITYGLLVVLAAWLAGPTRPACAVRRALAPTLRDHVGRAYGAAALALLLVVLWGPFPSTREVLPILGLVLLLGLGVHALRASTGRQFPDAQAGETMHTLRERFTRHGPRTPPAG